MCINFRYSIYFGFFGTFRFSFDTSGFCYKFCTLFAFSSTYLKLKKPLANIFLTLTTVWIPLERHQSTFKVINIKK